MAFKVKGSISSVDSILKGGVVFDNEKLQNSQQIPLGKFTINELDDSSNTDLAADTLVANFGKPENVAGMLSFNTGDWENNSSAPVKLMMRVINNGNDSNWVTIFDSGKSTVTWSSTATAGQTIFTVPNLDFKKAIIYINGVLQYQGLSYQIYGGTVTFSSKLNLGDQLYVIVGTDSDNTDISEYMSVAVSNQKTITLSENKNNDIVFINGIFQYPSSYTKSANVITLEDEMQAGDNILVFSNNLSINTDEFTSTGNQTDFILSETPTDLYVYINGVLQYDDSYTINDKTVSFITGLNEGDLVFAYLNDPGFIDNINTTYLTSITDVNNSDKLNIPYFNYSELQVFINGILQNPDKNAYDLNGTEITLSSPLQEGDDIHVIVYNSAISSNNFVTKAELSSYASVDELNYLKNALANEGINLKWNAHLPSIEVAFGLPRRSLKMWESGSTSNNNTYWLYPVDGSVWTGIGTLGSTPASPLYKIDSNKDVITWTYTATSDNISTIYIPYKFGNINIFINGVLQNIELGHYTYSGQYITLNGSINTGDNLIAILGKLILNGNPYVTSDKLSNYALKSELSNYVEVDSMSDYIEYDSLSKSDGYKFIGKVDSIAELRTIEPSISNQEILVKSYYSDSETGGGVFYYDSSDSSSLDNGGTVIVTNNNKRWKRVIESNIYKADDFGAVGDGITDDYKFIQNMLDTGTEGCIFYFEPGKTYYNAFANDGTYKAVLLRNMWIRSLGAIFKFNGSKLKRRLPEWNYSNLKNNYNTGSYYTDDHTALIWLNGGSNYIFQDGEIDCNVPVTNMVDVNGNKTSQTNYAVGTCMEFGIYATSVTGLTFTNMYVHNSVFPYYLEDCTNIVGNNLRIEYTAQASARVDGSDLMLGGGFKTLRCVNVDIKGVSGYRNANCTVEVEPNSDNVFVQGYSKYDFANSLVIVFSRNVEFDWKAYNVVQGSGLTIRGGATYETYNIRGKLFVHTASWMGANVFNSSGATTNMSGISIDITSYNCKKHGIGVYNNADTSVFIHAECKSSLWDDGTAESAWRYHGNVGGRISGSAHNFVLGAHKTGASTSYMIPVFDIDVRDRVTNGLAIGTGAIAECARVDHIDRTAITTSTELRIVPVTTAGASNTSGAVRIYGGTFDLRSTSFIMPNIQSTVPSTSGTTYITQDTTGQPTYTVKLYKP